MAWGNPSLIPGPYPESLTPSGRYVYNECCDLESFESLKALKALKAPAAAMLSRSGEPLVRGNFQNFQMNFQNVICFQKTNFQNCISIKQLFIFYMKKYTCLFILHFSVYTPLTPDQPPFPLRGGTYLWHLQVPWADAGIAVHVQGVADAGLSG